MNNRYRSIVFFLLMAPLTGCVELGPKIDLEERLVLMDTTYIVSPVPAADQKVVLFEEYTGVNCTFCPDGHQKTEEILSDHPGQVVAVAIHNDNSQAKPFDGEADFRTEEGIAISQQMGASGAIPVATVDRVVFPAESKEAVTRSKWANYSAQQVLESPKVNIAIENNFDPISRELRIKATIVYLEDVTGTSNLSLMITESRIVSPQKLQSGAVEANYDHDHVLRDMVTPPFGTKTNESTEKGRVVIKEFLFEVPGEWVVENLEVVGFVNKVGGSHIVLQATSEPVL